MTRRRVSEQAEKLRRYFEEQSGRAIDDDIISEFRNAGLTMMRSWPPDDDAPPPSDQSIIAAAIFLTELGQRARDGDDMNAFVRERLGVNPLGATNFRPELVRISDPEFGILLAREQGRITYDEAVRALGELGIGSRNARLLLSDKKANDPKHADVAKLRRNVKAFSIGKPTGEA